MAVYGWLTNTGVRFVIVVDMEGRISNDTESGNGVSALLGIRDAELKPAFRAIHSAYIKLLRNPFYNPDDHSPRTANSERRPASLQIDSPRFTKEMQRIGATWYPGIADM